VWYNFAMNMRKKSALFAVIFSGIFLWTSIASASTIYVNSSTGNDSTGNGSSGTPYATFTKGYTVASTSGDTLNITGTFSWSNPAETGATSTNSAGFTISKNITVTGQGTSTTFLEGSSTQESQSFAYGSVLTIASGATVTLNNLTVRYGAVAGLTGYVGGGITNNGKLTLQNSAVNYNSTFIVAYSTAGGIFCAGNASTLIISTSTISNNYDGSLFYGSAGVYAEANADTVTINASTFANNTTNTSVPTTNPYSYSQPSGALGMRTGTLTITNSTFYDNTTNSYGGALNIQNVTGVITNTTIYGNVASAGAGGILYTSDGSAGETLSVENTIIADNSSSSAVDDFYAYDATTASTVHDNGYNIVGVSAHKTWNATGDQTGTLPSLNMSTLGTNGATNGVQTVALLSGSSAIDAGTTTANAGVPVPTLDQRGFYRYGPTDIGAYEYNGASTPFATGYAVSSTTISTSPSGNSVIFYVSPVGGSTFGPANLTFSDGVFGLYPDGSEVLWADGLNPDTVLSEPLTLSVGDVSQPFIVQYQTIPDFNNDPIPGGQRTITFTNDQSWANASPIILYLPPNISGIATGTPSSSGATITWTTDEHTTSQVFYGTSIPYAFSSALNPTLSTSHSVTLSGLSSGMTYHFEIESIDGSSTPATSSDMTFTTTVGSSAPPVAYSSGGGGGTVSLSDLASILAPSPATTAYLQSRGYHVASTPVSTPLAPTSIPATSLASIIFTKNLSIGTIDPEVLLLQQYLNTHGFIITSSGPGSLGNETDKFGSLTKAALIKFQKAHGLPSTGYFGPMTRALIGEGI